jgi:hypothetical protein
MRELQENLQAWKCGCWDACKIAEGDEPPWKNEHCRSARLCGRGAEVIFKTDSLAIAGDLPASSWTPDWKRVGIIIIIVVVVIVIIVESMFKYVIVITIFIVIISFMASSSSCILLDHVGRLCEG